LSGPLVAVKTALSLSSRTMLETVPARPADRRGCEHGGVSKTDRWKRATAADLDRLRRELDARRTTTHQPAVTPTPRARKARKQKRRRVAAAKPAKPRDTAAILRDLNRAFAPWNDPIDWERVARLEREMDRAVGM